MLSSVRIIFSCEAGNVIFLPRLRATAGADFSCLTELFYRCGIIAHRMGKDQPFIISVEFPELDILQEKK